MLRDWQREFQDRVAWIREILGNRGVVYGNSGGKDCTLAGILCRQATENICGIIMPCQSSQNYGSDREHALLVARKYAIPTIEIDLSRTKSALEEAFAPFLQLLNVPEENIAKACMNINPRLRMTTLYTLAQARGALVCGTGNRSETTMGYFTKWGDGAYDFNPIADLTATEIFDFLRYLDAPTEIIEKAPSAGLFEGQTDEAEMGILYTEIDDYLLHGQGKPEHIEKIERAATQSRHKRELPRCYAGSRSSR